MKIKIIFAIITFLLLSCKPKFRMIFSPGSGLAFVATSDWMSSASYSTIDINSLFPYIDLGMGMVHTDVSARYFNGLVYIINKKGRDNIQILLPIFNFMTIGEFSVKDGFGNPNPHDIMVIRPDKAYVTRYDDTELWIVNPTASVKTGEIDLSGYDIADGIPEMDKLYYQQSTGRLFVTIQRLDRTSNWAQPAYSSVIVIDTFTDSVIKEVRLEWNGGADTATNPYSHFRFIPQASWQPAIPNGFDHLFVSCAGKFRYFHPGSDPASTSDGGIVAISLSGNLAEVECVGYIIEEQIFNADISDFVITPGGLAGYAITLDGNNFSHLVKFNPGTGNIIRTIHSNDGNYGFLWTLALHSSGKLFVCDRMVLNPGVRVYDTNNNDFPLNNNLPVYVGLPPEDIVFVE